MRSRSYGLASRVDASYQRIGPARSTVCFHERPALFLTEGFVAPSPKEHFRLEKCICSRMYAVHRQGKMLGSFFLARTWVEADKNIGNRRGDDMSKFIKNISIFFGGLPLLLSKDAVASTERLAAIEVLEEPTAVQLRPLNLPSENLFAGHRSHASHASHSSHASHYSGAGGGATYVAPAAPAPQYPVQNFAPPAAQTPLPNTAPKLTLSTAEKLKLQIMRVQIALTSLKLYEGPINGILNPETQTGLMHFQTLKGLPETGLMTTPSLNALGVPAVN